MDANSSSILGLGAIDFTPAWARKDPSTTVTASRSSYREDDRKAGGEKRPMGERKPMGARKPFGERKPFVPRPQPLDAKITVLPSSKALGTIIRKIQQDTHAYKLKDLAYFFLDNPQSVLLKVEPRAAEGQVPLKFVQCKVCGFASTDEGEVISHILTAHLGDYYDAKEIEVEPPKGTFTCVAKCGLSGVLLGPPNIHEFNSTVREMIRTKYPDMSEADYRARLEMVRDEESIEAWRKTATKRMVFLPKGQTEAEGAVPLTREQAEGEFKRNILPSLMETPKHLMLTADVAQKLSMKSLVLAVREAVEAERRAPYAMCFALRGAFHHRGMKFFRVNDAHGQEFVTSIEYRPFDTAHAIPELAKVATFIAEHPCCDKGEIGTDPETEKQLNWLVTTGHVVSFTNGVYSAVEKYPKYGPQWKKRAMPKAEVETKAEVEVEEPKVEEAKGEADAVAAELAE